MGGWVSVAAAAPSVILPLATQSLVTAITDSGSIAVGEGGHIFKADSNGDYRQILSPFNTMLTSVVDADGSVFAAGHDGLIMRSFDDGESWEPVQHLGAVDRPILDLVNLPGSGWIAVGAYGQMMRSSDGSNWVETLRPDLLSEDDRDYIESLADDPEFYQEELSFILPHLNRIRVHENKLLLAGEAGLLAVSESNGDSWQRLDIEYGGSFFDMAAIADGYLASGLRGNLFYAVELDKRWIALETCTTAILNRIVTLDNGDALILGNGGTLFYFQSSKKQAASKTHSARVGAKAGSSQNCSQSPELKRLGLAQEVDILDGADGVHGLVFATSRGVMPAQQLFTPASMQWLSKNTTIFEKNNSYDAN